MTLDDGTNTYLREKFRQTSVKRGGFGSKGGGSEYEKGLTNEGYSMIR